MRTVHMKSRVWRKGQKKITVAERPAGGIQLVFERPLRHRDLRQGKLKPAATSEIVRGRRRTVIGISLETEEALLVILQERQKSRSSA